MKIAVVGSRNFIDYSLLETTLTKLIESHSGELIGIVSGGARGADTLAEIFARKKGYQLTVFYPEWDKYGSKAGFMRNKLIVDASDVLVAFWDGISRGTKSSIDLANDKGIPVHITTFKI